MDEEERKAREAALGGMQAPTSAPVPSSAAGSAERTSPAAMGGGAGTGFVNFQQRLSANAGQGAAMAGKVAGGLQQEGEAVKGGVDAIQNGYLQSHPSATTTAPDLNAYDPARYGALQKQAGDVSARANLAGAGGAGFSSGLSRYYQARGGYSGGQGMLDAALAGAEGGDALRGVADKYGSLPGYLGGASVRAAQSQPLPPPMPAAPQTSEAPQEPGPMAGEDPAEEMRRRVRRHQQPEAR